MIEIVKEETTRQGLDIAKVSALRKAIIRLNHLRSQAILTKDSETEQAALNQFIAEAMLDNADEFVGTWLVAHNEYIPLCRAWTAFNRRCASFIAAPPAQARPGSTGVVPSESLPTAQAESDPEVSK